MAYFIGEHCSACHWCYSECPAKAIRFIGASYAIDPEKCTGCGHCAGVCPSGRIFDPEKPAPEPEKHELITKRCDLVVLGAGGAGLVAAVKFAQLTGKKVIVLEKAAKPGGNTNLGHGFIIRYSKMHEKAGLPDVRMDFIDRLYENSGRVLDYELLKNSTYALSDMFDWLCELAPDASEKFRHMVLHDRFGDIHMLDFPERTAANLKCSDTSMGPGWMGTYVVDNMLRQAQSLDIEILTEHAAEKLLLDENGKFAGVIASDPGGKTQVVAKACVIATGGFAYDDTLMQTIHPEMFDGEPVKRLSVASSTGDGMKLVSDIGGALDLERLRVPANGPVHHPYNFTVAALAGFSDLTVTMKGKAFTRNPHFIDVKMEGEITSYPGKKFYTVIDSAILKTRGDSLKDHVHDMGTLESRTNYLREIEEEANLGYGVVKAYSLDGLAEKIGINADTFRATVDEYNRMLSEKPSGGLPPFGPPDPAAGMPLEHPPFYAIKLMRFSESSSGGISVDRELQVLSSGGSPIGGLYAVGDSCNGLFLKDDLNGKFGEMPWAMASGYLAGQYAAGKL